MTEQEAPVPPPTLPPAPRRGVRASLDDWWPTVVRYAGMALAAWAAVVDNFEHPSALILAGGMMGLKEVLETRDRRKDP